MCLMFNFTCICNFSCHNNAFASSIIIKEKRFVNFQYKVNMPTGKVKWFNERKGYGFIEQESGKDLFVHHSEVRGGYLREGETVEFEVGEGQKGPCAVSVQTAS